MLELMVCAERHALASRGSSPGWSWGALGAKVLGGLIGPPFTLSGVLSMGTVHVLLGFL